MAQLAAWLLLGLLCSSQALSGGFGAPKAAKRKKKKRRAPAAAPAPPPPPPPPRAKPPAKAGAVDELASLMALQSSRAAYESRIAERCAHIDLEPGVEGGLAVIDDLLGPEACAQLRREAERVHADFVPGTLDEADVSNTRAELIRPEDFATRPRIVGLALSLAAALREPLMKHRGGVELTSDCAANMLSVYAAGGAFPVHVDNHGGPDDRRLYGAIYYMNPDLDEGAGGHFVPHRRKERDVLRTAADLEPLEPVAPKGDRLIIFEADALAHGVEAYRDAAYWRYALTVWILAADDVADLDAARRPEWRPLSPTATHSSMADADRASS